MAIAINVLEGNFDGTTQSTAYTTGSFTVTPGRLALLAVHGANNASGAPSNPTLGGSNGTTWVLIGSQNCTTLNKGQLWLYRAMESSTQTGTMTITPGGGETWLNAAWSIVEFSGVDQSGTSGSGAIVQSGGTELASAATSISHSLSAAGSASNRFFAVCGGRTTDTAVTPKSGWTEVHDFAGEERQFETQWSDGADADNVLGASWATSDSDFGIFGVELKAAADPLIYILDGQVDTTSRTSSSAYTTADISCIANELILLCWAASKSGAVGVPDDPTLGGTLSVTWVKEIEVSPEGNMNMVVWRAMPSSNQSGNVTLTPTASATLLHGFWSIVSFSGVDTSGTNGSGAIEQSESTTLGSSAETISHTLTNAIGSGNATFGFHGSRANLTDITPRTNWTEVHDLNGEQREIETQYRLAGEQTCSTSWTGADADVGLIVIEVDKAPTGGTAVPVFVHSYESRRNN